MEVKKLFSWMSPFALATLIVGAEVTATPATCEAREAGPQESQESPNKSEKQWRGRHGRGAPGRGPHGGMMRMFRELDLSPEQKDAIREGMEGQKELFKDAHQQLFAAKNTLQEASLRGDDESILQQYADAVGKAEAHSAFLMARQFAAVAKLLDSDQRAKLEEMHAKAQARRQEFQEGREERREEFRRRKQEQEL